MELTGHQKWYRNNTEKKKARNRIYHRKLRESVVAFLGGKCVKCGFSDSRALQIDHINGDGSIERVKTTVNFNKMVMEKLLEGSEEYQLLCANCNWIKRFENDEIRK